MDNGSSSFFSPGDVGRTVTVTNATNSANNGSFVISAQSSTYVEYTNTNVGAATESSTFNWQIDRIANHGQNGSFSIVSTTVTFTDSNARFVAADTGRTVRRC